MLHSRPAPSKSDAEATAALMAVPGVEKVNISFDSNIPADARLMSKMNIGVKNAIAVASGKGGGQSTIAANLA
jgi:ATP-binding protein involved in chromosome partitioning